MASTIVVPVREQIQIPAAIADAVIDVATKAKADIVALQGGAAETVTSAITAGTTRTQAGATALTTELNRVDTSTAPAAGSTLGDGVKLPAAAAGLQCIVINNTANNVQVYGAGSDTVNGVAGATGVAIPPGAVEIFESGAAGSWQYDAGMGSSGPLPLELAADSVSAAGSTQGAATQLVAAYNRVTTATANQGVKLPASAPGLDVLIVNHSGQPLTVYGAGTDKIDDIASATGLTQMDSSVVLFTCYASGNWYTNGAATGYAKNAQGTVALETVQFADALTAVGTAQANALQLAAAINTISSAAAGTGVNLPASAPGLSIVIQNNAANNVLVYPAQGSSDTINGFSAANGYVLPPGVVGVFNCTAAGAWSTQHQPAPPYYRARGVVIANVAALASFAGVSGGAPNNGVTYAQGDYVLLANQTTVTQNGLYQVGVVSGGVAPLTRVGTAATGQPIIADTIVQIGSEPTVGKNTQWRAAVPNNTGVYGTNDPQFVCDFGNYIDMTSLTVGTRAGSGAQQFFAAILLVAKTTGIFEVDCHVGFADGTTAETITMQLVSDTSAAGVLGGANNVAHGISGVTAAIGTIAAAGATCDTNGGAAVTYNSAAFTTAPILQHSDASPTLTGELSGSAMKFTFSGKCFNSLRTGTTKTPFTIGNTVAFGVSMSNAAGTVTIASIRLSAREVPAG